MKILIIGPSWVGDMVMSQSLYITLKHHYPNAELDVIAPSWCKPILERMQEVNRAIEIQIGHGEFNLLGRRALGKQLKNHGYTHAFVLPNSAKSALIPIFAQIPIRTGWKGEFRYGLLNDLRANKKDFQYMVERYVALAYSKKEMTGKATLANCPTPSLKVDLTNQFQLIQDLKLSSDKPVIGLCPGAEFGPAKCWPASHYAKATEALIQRGYQVWLFGSDKDLATSTEIQNKLTPESQKDCHILAGKTRLIDAVDLIAYCETIITNDSGLMHIAAAVGCNIVAVYGSTSPHYTPPLTEKVEIVKNNLDCQPCFKRQCPLGHLDCLTKLDSEKVIEAVDKLTGNSK